MGEESSLTLTDEQVNELKDCFEFFDSNKAGELKASDLKRICGELGLPNSGTDIDEMMKEVDSGKTGKVTFPMFLSMMSSRMMQVDSEDNLNGAFKIFDQEITGKIPEDRIKEVDYNW